MEIRPLSSRYAVSPQISVEHLPAIAAAGIRTVICNRPDDEVGPEQQACAIGAAARAAGLRYEVLALTQQTMTPENIARQRALIDNSDGPVLAYCRTGTRCSIIWSLAMAGALTVDEIIAATTAAGYQLSEMRPYLEHLAQSGKG